MKTKRIFFGLLVCIGLFTASCSSDDNEGETLIPLEGKWNLSKTGSVIGGTETLIDAPENASGCNRDYLELKLDNTATIGDYDSAVSACALTTKAGIYSRSHNNLTTVIDGVSKTQDIVNLTLSELKVRDAAGIITVYTR
ncbi:lipocalin family protein [Flavobacterium branchiicola]|uniref:Lipocalin family protein n=1 Tax=Flavobacterium branchiicola TaxID=1114875 RepID=A0ABV9PKP4_9FLAO|nr:lipocalin family protein [Flavobacterium branchiicola]MBS7256659.1 lipocalin family protein [Flavobacterium branchiicola]